MARNDMQGLKNRKGSEEDVEPVVQEDQESTLIDRSIEWFSVMRDKLKLGPHYRMERFTVLLSTTLVFLLMFTGMSFASYRSDVSQLATAQAIFTEQFNFSLSNQKMYVDGIYGNKEQTDVMVLLRMQDPKGMSANAENYQLFITGKDKSLKYEPDVSFALFGTTGYGIIRFQSDTPLNKEIVDITIRANSELSGRDGTGTSGEKDSTDGSFSKYDQGKLYVNPGADNVTVLDNFQTGEEDPAKLYISLVADEKDKAIRKKVEDETKELSKLLNRASEYSNRLVSAGFIPPTTPWFIEGDYVDDVGVLHAAKNLSRSHAFDYYTKSIHDGYINQVMGDLSEFDGYMQKTLEQAGNSEARDAERKEQVERANIIQHEDGSTLDIDLVSTGISTSAQVSAKDSVESLMGTWRTYVNIKQKIQRDLMRDFLILDADVLSQPVGFSENNKKDGVTFY